MKLTTAEIKAILVAHVSDNVTDFSEDAKIAKNWKRTAKYYCFGGWDRIYKGMPRAEYNRRKRVFIREFSCGDVRASVETNYPEDTAIVHFEVGTI